MELKSSGGTRALALASALGLLLLASPAAAKDLLGAWTFRGGDMSGTMVFTAKNGNTYDCEFNAAQSGPASAFAEQSCKAYRNGSNLVIKSRIVSASTPTYAPDDFRLVINGASMYGELISLTNVSVVFNKF